MRIHRLSVRNFKGFGDATWAFADVDTSTYGSFHLIIGENAAGKTAILDALSVSAGSWFLGIRGYDSRHIQATDVRRLAFRHGSSYTVEEQYPVEVTAEGQVGGHEVLWRRTLTGPKSRTSQKDAGLLKTIALEIGRQVMQGAPVTLPLISYYGTGRLWQEPRDVASDGQLHNSETDVDAKTFSSRFAGYRYSIDPRCSPRDLLRWMRHQRRVELDEESKVPSLQVVLDAIRRCLPGCEDIRFNLRLDTLLVTIKDKGTLPFSSLSDGQRNMLALVGDIAFKASQLNPHLDGDVLQQTPGVVLIDELDLHLHPRWQRHVVEDLRSVFPSIQFFATTHSPFIIQTVRDGELISLDGPVAASYAGRGIEEIAQFVMGVSSPETSPRFKEMTEVANRYFGLLEQAKTGNISREAQEQLKRELTRMTAPYADNPAYVAFLEQKRYAAGLGDEAD